MAGRGRLADRGCLIVGGTSGIGLAAARRFLAEGARLVVTGLDPKSTSDAMTTLGTRGLLGALVVDVSQPDSVVQGVQAAIAVLQGRLDVLLHVAGQSGRKWGDAPLHECTVEGWDAVQSSNARGVFLSNREALRVMLAQPLDDEGLRGSVVNVGSVLDRSPSPAHFGTIAYAASKGAIRALTLASASRYATDRIRFNLLVPGLIDTPMAARAVNDPTIRRFLATKQPLSEGPGAPTDCAEAALFLAEPASKFVTGAELTVDGGWSVSEGSA
ncbi:MAG: SDR family NAD(P)-dependent oxidoreductase [Isosphaeraceae bacterium]